MILEFLEYCLTPASRLSRALGFVRSSIQVKSRFSRCRKQWEPHLENTRNAILSAVESCSRRGTVAVLGAGLLHDIPLGALSRAFGRVLLVDAVHPLSSRVRSGRFRNVIRVTADLTECAHLLRASRNPRVAIPRPMPRFLLHEGCVDLVLSVNVLSQLGWIPSEVLRGHRTEEEIGQLKSHLVRAHLEYLRSFSGRVSLVTDFEWCRFRVGGPRGEPDACWSVLQGVDLPRPDGMWEWEIAPAPEKEADADLVARVGYFGDWKQASEGRCWLEESVD